jgi:hypothetical protein
MVTIYRHWLSWLSEFHGRVVIIIATDRDFTRRMNLSLNDKSVQTRIAADLQCFIQ